MTIVIAFAVESSKDRAAILKLIRTAKVPLSQDLMVLFMLLPFKFSFQLEENRQRAVQPKDRVRFLAGEGDFSLLLSVNTRTEAQLFCYFLGTAGSFLEQHNARGMKLAIYLHLMSSMRMSSTMLPNLPVPSIVGTK